MRVIPVLILLAACDPGGEAIELASGEPTPEGLAINSSHVYWVDGENEQYNYPGRLWRVPKSGGPKELVYDSESLVIALAADDTGAYLLDEHGNVSRHGEGGMAWVRDNLSNRTVAQKGALTIAGDEIYFALDYISTWEYGRVAKRGGAATSLAIDGWPMVVTADAIYTAVNEPLRLRRYDRAGTLETEFAVEGSLAQPGALCERIEALAADGDGYVYYSACDNWILRVPERGGAAERRLSYFSTLFRLFGAYIYTASDGIRRHPRNHEGPHVGWLGDPVATNFSGGIYYLEVDASGSYFATWGTDSDGRAPVRIYRAPR